MWPFTKKEKSSKSKTLKEIVTESKSGLGRREFYLTVTGKEIVFSIGGAVHDFDIKPEDMPSVLDLIDKSGGWKLDPYYARAIENMNIAYKKGDYNSFRENLVHLLGNITAD